MKKKSAFLFVLTMALSLYAAIAVSASSTPVYRLASFEGLTVVDGEWVNNNAIQAMTWSNPAHGGSMAGTTLAIDGNVLTVSGGAEASGIQFGAYYGNTQMFQGTPGKMYRIVIDASTISGTRDLYIAPDNHPAGVAKKFEMTAERATYELIWTQVENANNNLQISSLEGFKVYSVSIFEIEPRGDDLTAEELDYLQLHAAAAAAGGITVPQLIDAFNYFAVKPLIDAAREAGVSVPEMIAAWDAIALKPLVDAAAAAEPPITVEELVYLMSTW